MATEESQNLFRKVHQEVQERRDRIHEARRADSERRSTKEQEEADREGFNRG
jgi:hypothetical protein